MYITCVYMYGHNDVFTLTVVSMGYLHALFVYVHVIEANDYYTTTIVYNSTFAYIHT